MQGLKPAFGTVSLHVVAQGRSSRGDGLFQNLRDGFRKGGAVFFRKGKSLSLGMNAAAEQRLTHIDISQTCNQLLVEERRFYRRTTVPEQICQCRPIHDVRKRLHAQMGQETVTVLLRSRNQINHPEAPGIDQPCPRTAFRLQNQMLVRRWSRIRPRPADRESARHPQMQ